MTHFRQACLALLFWLVSSAASAGPVDPYAPLELDIPAQALTSALERFSRSTGMAVLVDRQLTRGRRSIAVKGRLNATDALSLMLSGSGLMARYARADAFTLQVAQVAEVPLQAGAVANSAPVAGGSYAAAIQTALERRLCRSPLTRPGSFRALLQLWIGRDGVVQHSRLVSSTGDGQRDSALVESLRNLRIERPAPSALGQPVTLLLLPQPSGKRMECTQWEGVSGG
ncbi:MULTISPECIES: STN domain-containing protein [Pseudomonas]|uniref:TonB-dependent outer membrane receptor n=1 Tax=Pseudomonas frederiksbergensis TaxID=104087 RepID=A0A2S8HNZ1_9PSED|nr:MULTISPECIES: TonB-dependent outer membrane receptor [Pseudomonas]PQP04095.1 TonB-dependent outer membrane receptor [Pseudomonas frederiksbergensis]WLG53254.1 TonB-dependent outer membrane receptor [Pseudomonas sp. FP1742]